MTLSNKKTDGMKYEIAGGGKSNSKQVAIQATEGLHTGTILWLLVRRHKVGLLGTWAIAMTALYLMPFLPDTIMSMF